MCFNFLFVGGAQKMTTTNVFFTFFITAMASQKRKSPPVRSSAKRQKLDKDHEHHSVTTKKTNGKSKTSTANHTSAKKKSVLKPQVKANTPAKKAIKKPPSRLSPQKVLQKKINERKSAKANTAKSVPVKRSVLKTTKEAPTSSRITQVSRSSGQASTASKRGKAENKRANMQNSKNTSKVGKNLVKNTSLARLKVSASGKNEKSKTGTKRSSRLLELKQGKAQSKETPKNAKKNLSIRCTKTEPLKGRPTSVKKTPAQNKGNIELRGKADRKSIQKISASKESAVIGKKKAHICTITHAQPKESSSKKHGKQLQVTITSSQAKKSNSRQSKRTPRLSSLSPANRKTQRGKTQECQGQGIKTAVKSRTLRTRVKGPNEGTKLKAIQNEGIKNMGTNNGKAIELASFKSNTDVTENEVDACCLSSGVSLSKEPLEKAEPTKWKTSSTDTPAKKKTPCAKASPKKVTVERRKTVSGTAKNKPTPSLPDVPKAKRISILDICNEIAGEIESDTVEVKKDVPSSQDMQQKDHLIEENKESAQPEAIHLCHGEEKNKSHSKRFFSSRTAVRLKCKLDRKTSPALKNSKWNKIKLNKANNLSRMNIPRNRAILPNLDVIKARSKLSQTGQLAASTLDKTLDKKLPVEMNTVSYLPDSKKTKPAAIQKNKQEKTENGVLDKHINHDLEITFDEGFRLHLDSSPESSPLKKPPTKPPQLQSEQQNPDVIASKACASKQLFNSSLTDQMAPSDEGRNRLTSRVSSAKSTSSEANIQKEVKKLKEAEKDGNKQAIIDAGQKRFGAISCNVCGMLYTASNPEDEAQHLLFHNQFISAVKYVGWKKERIVAEFPDGRVIMVLPDDPKYALKKVDEIREMVDNDLGFQQVPLRLHSRTKTLLFISNDKKVVGCLIAEHIQWGYRVIDDLSPEGTSEKEKAISERVKAWCCSTSPEPAICGVSRIWVFSMMRRKKIASRMLECLSNNFNTVQTLIQFKLNNNSSHNIYIYIYI
uniref:Establishment of sister chromatid cohesion N-acetyltransferase 1 n=1 Tax=Xenopus tropicalis TaxID=8364 RepID=A0A6I8RJV3_XENTR